MNRWMPRAVLVLRRRGSGCAFGFREMVQCGTLLRGYFTALRLKASLAGRSRHETQGSAKIVGVRIPNPATDTHLSCQLILPPLSTGPDQTLTREALVFFLPFFRLAHKILQPFEIAAALDDVGTILRPQLEILRRISKNY
jgi:hypothetical protein